MDLTRGLLPRSPSKASRPQGVRKERKPPPPRRSARLRPHSASTSATHAARDVEEHIEEHVARDIKKDIEQDAGRQIKQQPSPALSPPPQPTRPKRAREDDLTEPHPDRLHDRPSPLTNASPKRRRKSARPSAPQDLIDYWRREHTWPPEYFETDNIEAENIHEAQITMDTMYAQKKTPSLRRKRSENSNSLAPSSVTTASDQQARDRKSAPYDDFRYEALLTTLGSFMDESEQGITPASQAHILTLLDTPRGVPTDSLFRDDLFEATVRKIRTRNETRVIRDIAQLIVPSAETLATYGSTQLDILVETVNEGWNNCMPFTTPRPQPDYSVGFTHAAFSATQLAKLEPFTGTYPTTDTSLFMATYYMYFPFLTCEVKCGSAALDVADRQNAHSMSVAVRGVMMLFQRVGRVREVSREILAWSISHDHQTVRIYGHYGVVEPDAGGKSTSKPKISYYRHPIRAFSFMELGGKEKWTAYRFVRNVYEIWMPMHFARICSAVDDLPLRSALDAPSGVGGRGGAGDGIGMDLASASFASSALDSNSEVGVGIGSVGDGEGQGRDGTGTPDTAFTGGMPVKRVRRRR